MSERSSSVSRGYWCRDFRNTPYPFDAYLEKVKAFHGNTAPGLVIGGKMVDLALDRIPEGVLFDAISETANCLPDAIQILTLCTIGNGWLKILPFGRFALALYDKSDGRGVRVSIDLARLAAWTEFDSWFFARKAKADQDFERLMSEIREADSSVYRVAEIRVTPGLIKKAPHSDKIVCPSCGESYPAEHGPVCRGCGEESPYLS